MASIARQWGYVGDVNRTDRNIEFLTNDEVKSAADEILDLYHAVCRYQEP